MKRVLIALAICAALSPAKAQVVNIITPNAGGSSSLVPGSTTISGGTNGNILFDNNGVLGEVGTTGSGSVVLATSPTFSGIITAPAASLGSPSYTFSGHTAAGVFYNGGVVIGSTANFSYLFDTNGNIVGQFNGANRAFINLESGTGEDVGLTPGSGGSVTIASGKNLIWVTSGGSIGTSGGTNPTDIYLSSYQHWGGETRVGTQFNITSSTSLTNITGLSATVRSGKTYQFWATLYTSADSAGGVQASIGGTATATSIVYEGESTNSGSVVAQTRATALGSPVGGVTNATAARIDIYGTITVNAGGTLTVQFAQNASDATQSSVLVGSTFFVQEF